MSYTTKVNLHLRSNPLTLTLRNLNLKGMVTEGGYRYSVYWSRGAKGQWTVSREVEGFKSNSRGGTESDGPGLLIVPHLDLLSIWCQREIMDGSCRFSTFQMEKESSEKDRTSERPREPVSVLITVNGDVVKENIIYLNTEKENCPEECNFG